MAWGSIRAFAGVVLMMVVLGPGSAWAQDTPSPLPTPRPDSAAVAPPDTLVRADSLVRPETGLPAPSRPAPSNDGLGKPVQFSSSDSLIIRFDDGTSERARLVGNASATFDDVTLQAHAIEMLFEQNELHAEALRADTGYVGLPQFTQANESFTGLSFTYNLETERGRVVETRTQMQEGFIQAEVAKVTEDSTVYVLNGSYTTCDCDIGETPSYSLRARRMKVVDQKWIYTGPIQLFIYNIPMPLILPFGFLPAQEGRRSGLLPPEYGEDQRGFYLRNWGYYWAINEYIDMQVRAGLWTKGSWQLNPSFRYNRRDRYGGSLSIDYLRERSGERDDPDLRISNTSRVTWNHNQTLNPTARLTANVNLSSRNYMATVSEQYNDNVSQSISSSIQYNKRFSGGRKLALNLRQNQTFSTGRVDMTLPELSFSQNSLTPFQSERRATGQDERWYERITVSYTGRLTNRYTFQPLDEATLIERGDSAAIGISWFDAIFDPEKYERATGEAFPFDFQAAHHIPVSAPFNIERLPLINKTFRLNLSPNLTYSEDWLLQTERRMADSTNRPVTEEVSEFFALRQVSAGVSANTTLYGIFPVNAGPYRGIRHTLRPSLSFSYSPDYSSDFWGYTRTYQDTSGKVIEYPIVPGVPTREQQVFSFSLSNVFETRRVREDTTGEQQRTVLKLFNVDLNTGYDLAADSLNLRPISLNARTNILGKMAVQLNATFSPYELDPASGRDTRRYLFSLRDLRFARLTRLNISSNFRLTGGQGGSPRTTADATPDPRNPNLYQPTTTSTLGVPDPFDTTSPYTQDGYTNFSIPWSLNVRMSYGLTPRVTNSQRTFTVNTNFDFNVTPNWKVRGNTGYDFERGEIVTTSLNIARNFECWEMSISWVPFGSYQSWGFDLHVKSGHLRDLLRIRQPRAERRRFGL